MSRHCVRDHNQIYVFFKLLITLAPGDAAPYQVWLEKVERFRRYIYCLQKVYDHTDLWDPWCDAKEMSRRSEILCPRSAFTICFIIVFQLEGCSGL